MNNSNTEVTINQNKVHLTKFQKMLQSYIRHYDHKKYWKMRERVINYKNGVLNKLLCYWYLFRIKRMDAFNNASMGTSLGFGASFAEPPIFPHGIQGIIVAHNAKIGKHCIILHSVTIGNGHGGSPVIGDNCEIGTGAILIGGITIGNNCRIGANCIVAENIPDNSTVVMPHPRIINKHENKIIYRK